METLEVFYSGRSGLQLYNNGKALEIDADLDVFVVGTDQYRVKDVLLHAPSEHTINGKSYGAEMQVRCTTESKHPLPYPSVHLHGRRCH